MTHFLGENNDKMMDKLAFWGFKTRENPKCTELRHATSFVPKQATGDAAAQLSHLIWFHRSSWDWKSEHGHSGDSGKSRSNMIQETSLLQAFQSFLNFNI